MSDSSIRSFLCNELYDSQPSRDSYAHFMRCVNEFWMSSTLASYGLTDEIVRTYLKTFLQK